jgi:lauroyl/myristoyl acyltransferase
MTSNSPGARFKLAAAWTAFNSLLWCERHLPTDVMSLLMWPPAIVRNLRRVRLSRLLISWNRLPSSWRPNFFRFLVRQTFGLYHGERVHLWPDRLCTERWRSRCRVEGDQFLKKSDADGRGVVLASLHFGAYETLPYWLRAHGIVTTMVRGEPALDALKSLSNYQYSLSPPADVPLFLSAHDFVPLPRFAHVRQLVRPGQRLLVMVDVDRGLQDEVPFVDRVFRMASGAIHLAAMASADLIPCLIWETGPWKFQLFFGTPVPRQYLGKSPDLQAIGRHLLGEFARVIARHPEQCRWRMLSAFLPPEVNSAAHATSESQESPALASDRASAMQP